MSRRAYGEGSITQRKDGRWQASIQVDGKRRVVYGRTRSEAAAKFETLKRDAARAAALPDPGKRTLDDLLAAWLEVQAPAWKPRTLADYTTTAACYLRPTLGKVRLDRLTPDRIERLYARYQTEGKHRTALKCHQVLAQALALAVRWGWLAANPCERVGTPRYQPERKAVWSAQEVRAFLDGTAAHPLHPLWLFLATSGCRLGEALALEWADVNLATGVVTVSKPTQRIGGQWVNTEPKTRPGVRKVTLPPEGVAALRRLAESRLAHGGGSLVFAADSGGALTNCAVSWHLRQECRRLGLPHVSPHGLRHAHASLLLAEGLPLPEVSRRLGHANTGITAQVYSHAVRDDSAAAAAISRALGGGEACATGPTRLGRHHPGAGCGAPSGTSGLLGATAACRCPCPPEAPPR